eukprot:TRINITY_DN1319_c1_g2_i2.p1 TRINITY_DN1319_c1_g2~~TRINITY_DN1319_c1_g2_i2.p1  ORF type:complete len:469 (-),score=119.60 TRINITY_DN1319_c1_g2_i2:337-1743(-)
MSNNNHPNPNSSSILSGQHVIKARWKILKKIGQGAFGEIHQAKNVITGEMVAVKVERVDSKKQVLKLEVAVLKKLQECPYVCRFITCGRFTDYNYLVMELLGENLSELRRRQVDGKFSIATTLRLGIQMLLAIEASHELGYLHRDIKPSNFVMGDGAKRNTVFMIDFGLSRRYVLNNGEIRQARDSTGFRGTARYASIHSHLSQDLGRRDDLWSLLYVLIEFIRGSLPWRKIKDKDAIGEMKQKCSVSELLEETPPEFHSFYQHLVSLGYSDKPDYKHLKNLLETCYRGDGGDENTPYDWELAPMGKDLGVKTAPILSPGSTAPIGSFTRTPSQQQLGKDTEDGSRKEKENSFNSRGSKGYSSSRFASSVNRSTGNKPTPKGFTEFTGERKSSYVSSNLDSLPDVKQHRRASSLPANLGSNHSRSSAEDSQVSQQSSSKSPSNSAPNSPFPFKKVESKRDVDVNGISS